LFRERRGKQAFLASQGQEIQRGMLRQAQERGLTPSDLGQTLKGLSDNPEARAITQPWRQRIDANALELATRGLLDPQTMQANLGRYARRVYLRDILGSDYIPPPEAVARARAYLQANLVYGRGPAARPATAAEVEGVLRDILRPKSQVVLSVRGRPRIPLDPVKRRKDIPEEIRDVMGEVQDGSYLAARTVMDQEAMLINDDFFRAIRGGSEPMALHGRTVQVPWVRDTPAPGYRQLPDAKDYGALRNLYALDKYADDIIAMGRRDAPNALLDAYFDYINYFKISKTAMNPATHARNITGNLAFADFAGIPPWDPRVWPDYRKAFALLREGTGHPLLREALEHGAIGTEMVGPDIQRLAHRLHDASLSRGVFGALLDTGKHGVDAVGRIYNLEDQIFKLTAYVQQRRLGVDPRQAAQHVNDWFPNYAEVGPAIRALRGSERTPGAAVAAAIGNPFVSFKAEAIRIAVNAGRRHPIKLVKWLAAPATLTTASMAAMGVGPDEARQAFRTLPEYLQQPFTVLLPWRDRQGNLQFWDMTYYHFLGDLIAANPRTPAMQLALGRDNPITASAGEMVSSFFGGSPFVTSVIQALHNRDFFTGKPVIEFPVTSPEGARQVGEFLLKDVLPVPPMMTRGPEAIRAAGKGLPGRFGETISVAQAFLETLTGIRAVGTGSELKMRQARVLRGRVNDLIRQMYGAAADPDTDAGQRRLRALNNQVRRLLAQFSQPTVAEHLAVPPVGVR